MSPHASPIWNPDRTGIARPMGYNGYMNMFDMLFGPIVDFFNALFGLLMDLLLALQHLMNSLFEAIAQLFGG